MSVYVDRSFAKYGRMLMCHMIADTRTELLQMADAIGVARQHIQKRGTPNEHFDICKAKRERAVRLGAMEITSRQLVEIIASKRSNTQSHPPNPEGGRP
jgi:hypothetical protein